jgi:hypothetical protein
MYFERRITGTSGFNLELDCATSIQQAKEETCLVDRAASGEEAVVEEDGDLDFELSSGIPRQEARGKSKCEIKHLVFGTQSVCNILPLLLCKYNAPILRIDRDRVIQVTDILVNHIESFAKCGPGPPSVCVSVANGVDVRPRFVDLGVNEETCCICYFVLPFPHFSQSSQHE